MGIQPIMEMSGLPSTPNAPLRKALAPIGAWGSVGGNFYKRLIPEGSKAKDFNLTVPKEVMALELWGKQKVVPLKKWFTREGLKSWTEIQDGLGKPGTKGNQSNSEVMANPLLFMELGEEFRNEIKAGVDMAYNVIHSENDRDVQCRVTCLRQIGIKLSIHSDAIWKTLKERLGTQDFADPWIVWRAKKTLIGYNYQRVLVEEFRDYL